MQRKHWTLVSFGLLAIAATAYASGCRTNGCNVDPDCGDVNSQGGGGTGGIMTECIPAKNHEANKTPVKDECGIFVRLTGDDENNEGTLKAKPFATIGRALELAKETKKPIYLCAEIFPEAIEVPKGISIYGGLNCSASWIYAGDTKKTTIAPDPDLVPIKFPNDGDGTTAHVEDVIALAADATLPGGSSIAAIADSVTVELVRSELIAGNGMGGDEGTTPSDVIGPTDPTDVTIAGDPGNNACMGGMMGNFGGDPITNPSCESTGGKGGTGQEGLGEPGADGTPTPSPNPLSFGVGGLGAAAGGGSCKAGTNGATGDNGIPGVGATADLGIIDFDGYRGTDGSSGERGRPGQGGGGGGGAKGKTGCYGASGGSGGAGGCGGFGGTGGKAGGASIALISLGATLTFDQVKLVTATGGSGGGGGLGQQGATGGKGAAGGLGATMNGVTLAACTGGDGGVGGTGGRGGGGRGGHSIGIAWKGLAPPEALMDVIEVGFAGNGGPGDDATNAGAEGQSAPMLEFP